MTKQEILKQADQYVGHPTEIDESLEAYSTRRAFVDGAEWMQKKMIAKAWLWHITHKGGVNDYDDFVKAMEGTK